MSKQTFQRMTAAEFRNRASERSIQTAIVALLRLLGIETKSAKGKLRASQIACHKWLEDSGALVIVPRSIEEVAAALIEVGITHQALSRLLQKPNAARCGKSQSNGVRS